MAFTVGDRGIVQGRAVLPWNGVWSFDGRLNGDGDPPAPGARVQITLGTLVLSGTVENSGSHAGRPEILVVGGADGWRRRLPRRNPYRDRAGVKLALVAADIASDAGERAVVAPELAGEIVGYAWTRPAITASSALGMLRVAGEQVPWHVRPEGWTWIGGRPRVALEQGVEVVPTDIQPGRKCATLSLPGDDFAKILPGTLLGLPGIPADAPVRELAIAITSDSARAHVDLGSTTEGIFRNLLERAREVASFYGAHVYQVVQQFGDQVTVRPLSSAEGLPEELILDKAHGLPGASATLQKGALVLVTWRGGNPGWPIVVGYFGSRKPSDITLDAEQLVRIGPNVPDLDGGHGVHIGGGARPVAMGDALETYLPALRTLLGEIVAALAPLPGSPLALAWADEIAAYNDASSTPLGFSSTKLGTL